MILPLLFMAADPRVDVLARCLSIADDAGRLACLENGTRALIGAVARGDAAVVDRATRDAESRRAAAAPPPVEAVDSTLAAASAHGDDHWTLHLADGSRWDTEVWTITRTLRPGIAVTVRRASLGGYVLHIPGERSVRVRRVG